jgi:hypothetical protein
MNYYEARNSGDKWFWTRMNDGVIRISTPCTGDCQHKTREEAERHDYDHVVASLEKRAFDSAYPCAVCGVWTNEALVPRGRGGLEVCFLCVAHMKPEYWVAENPFVPGRQIISSM